MKIPSCSLSPACIFLCIFTLPSIAIAQYEYYDLKNYVQPDYKRKALDFSFNANGNFNSSLQQIDTLDVYEWREASAGGNITPVFSLIKNSANQQSDLSMDASIRANYLYNSNGYEYNNPAHDGENFFSFTLNDETRLYHNPRDKKYVLENTNTQLFLLLAPYASISYFHEQLNWNEKPYKTNTFNTSAAISIGVGIGRVEQVGDARKAIYIIEDLQKKGGLKKRLTDREITQFASLITTIKNKRSFDSRIKLMEDITAIDSFLISSDYITNPGVAYYTTLYDNWLYAGENRKSGNRFEIGIRPSGKYSKRNIYQTDSIKYDNKEQYKQPFGSLNIFTDFVSYKPLNLYWQQDIHVRLSTEWRKWNLTYQKQNSKTKNNQFSINAYTSYQVKYYPNSRSNYYASVYGDFSMRNHDHSTDYFNPLNYLKTSNEKEDFFSIYTGLKIGLYYYISPQLRFDAQCSMYYNLLNDHIDRNTSYNDQTYPNHHYSRKVREWKKYPECSFNATFTYSIF